MKQFLCDFHLHSLLSPCAEIEMTPHHIVMQAAKHGIDAIALTDHNSTGNVAAAFKAGKQYGVTVLAGMEVECAEEAHLVVLFDTQEQCTQWQMLIDAAHCGLLNNPQKFGAQFVVDEEDNFLYEEERLLLAAVALTAKEVIEKSRELGGLCFAAHIDRPSYSLLGQLGFWGDELALDGAEISARNLRELQERALAPLVAQLPYLTNSDAHRMEEFLQGPKNLIEAQEINVAEIKKALQGIEDRKILPGKFLPDKR